MSLGSLPIDGYINYIQNSGAIWAYVVSFIAMTIWGPIATVTSVILAHNGILYLPYLLPLSLVAEVLSDNLWFFLGRHGGKYVLRLLAFVSKRFNITPRHQERLEKLFREHTGKLILAIKFSYGFTIPGFLIAGHAKTDIRKFLYWITIASVPWIAVLVVIGLAIGETLQALQLVNTIQFVTTGVVMAILAIVLLRFARKHLHFTKLLGLNKTDIPEEK